jgi:16S rRNA processing protein RimM
MGRVVGSYGLRGWIRVDRPEDGLAACRAWWIDGVEYPVEDTKEHSGALLAKLAGIGSPETAQKLRGALVSVSRAVLPEPQDGRFYMADLVGLEVLNEQGVALGVVKQLYSNGAHDVMELEGERTRLLPWVPTVVKSVDLAEGRIYVEWEADW